MKMMLIMTVVCRMAWATTDEQKDMKYPEAEQIVQQIKVDGKAETWPEYLAQLTVPANTLSQSINHTTQQSLEVERRQSSTMHLELKPEFKPLEPQIKSALNQANMPPVTLMSPGSNSQVRTYGNASDLQIRLGEEYWNYRMEEDRNKRMHKIPDYLIYGPSWEQITRPSREATQQALDIAYRNFVVNFPNGTWEKK